VKKKRVRYTSKRFPLGGANVSTSLKRVQSYLQSNHRAEDLVSLSLESKQFHIMIFKDIFKTSDKKLVKNHKKA
jgi:hypothetical protein